MGDRAGAYGCGCCAAYTFLPICLAGAISSRLPGLPGSEPLTTRAPFSASTASTSTFRSLARTLPICKARRSSVHPSAGQVVRGCREACRHGRRAAQQAAAVSKRPMVGTRRVSGADPAPPNLWNPFFLASQSDATNHRHRWELPQPSPASFTALAAQRTWPAALRPGNTRPGVEPGPVEPARKQRRGWKSISAWSVKQQQVRSRWWRPGRWKLQDRHTPSALCDNTATCRLHPAHAAPTRSRSSQTAAEVHCSCMCAMPRGSPGPNGSTTCACAPALLIASQALRTVLALGLGAVGHEAAGKAPTLDAALEALADGGARHVHQVARLRQRKEAGVRVRSGVCTAAKLLRCWGAIVLTLQPSPFSNAGAGAWQRLLKCQPLPLRVQPSRHSHRVTLCITGGTCTPPPAPIPTTHAATA